MVSVTCRTEYLTARHHRAATTAWVAMVLGLIALVVLNIAGVSGMVTAGVAAGLVAVSLASAAVGRLGERGAVLLAVDSDSVYLGDEDRNLVSYPLATLSSVSLSGPADTTTAPHGDVRDLRVRGRKYLTLGFDPVPHAGAQPGGRENWKIAVVDSDPAAAEVIDRLRRAAPERTTPKTKPAAKAKAAAAETKTAGTKATGTMAAAAKTVVTEDGDAETPAPPAGPRIADAGTDDAAQRLWEEATRRHDTILGEYAAYELDPAMVLRYPAITDVTVESTQTFHMALDEAMALRTDTYPGTRSRADAYQQAVAGLRRAWIACEAHGKKVGVGYLEPGDQDDLDTALKLYRHAAGSVTPAEQATYFGRVHDIVTSMTERGGLHPPQAAVAELKAATRRAIEAGGS